MRKPATATASATGLALAVLLAAAPVRAEEPDGGLALFAGSATELAGFAVGGLLLGTSHDRSQPGNAGWLSIQAGFALAPLAAHAVVGEWGRGAIFSAMPAAMWGASAALIQYAPDVVAQGTLEEQRALWAFFCVAFASSAYGVVDAAFAGSRAAAARTVRIAPMGTAGGAGLSLEGLL